MARPPSKSTVFVGYPWSPYDRDDYKRRYRSVEQKHGVQFVFAEDRLTSDHLIAKIEAMMITADFCIFDLTGLNPNVALEYGLARGLRLECYIAFNARVGERDVPSDLKGLDSLRYESLEELENRLDAFLSQAMAAEERRRRSQKSELPSRDEEQYDEELARVSRGPILSKIESRGHWLTRIRPERYEPGRIEYRKLMDVVGTAKVQRRSYSFPFTDALHNFPQLGLDWYGREFDMSEFKESWRMFQSGQFVQRRAIPEDWPEEWIAPLPAGLASLKNVMPIGAASQIFETFQFAAGLASALPGADGMIVSLTASPMAQRELLSPLSFDDLAFDFELRGRRTLMDAFRDQRAYSREDLRSSSTTIAMRVAAEFFDRFGLNVDEDRLRRWVRLPAEP